MFDKYYILNKEGNIQEASLVEWGSFFKDKQARTIARTVISGILVSTVFLGIDHGFGDNKKPVLFETMIFGGKHDEYQTRYCTMKEAKKGHEKAVKLVKKDV